MGVTGLALAGVAAGWQCTRLSGRWWLAGYFVPLSFVVLVGMARRFPRLELQPPFAWVMAGRMEFALLAFVSTMLLITLVPRLPHRRERILMIALLLLVTAHESILPFLSPAFNYRYLRRLETIIDSDGVCLQSNDYTCGPAAAVTALRRLGFEAGEGQLAILARTTRFTGTPPDLLCRAVQEVSSLSARVLLTLDVNDLQASVPFIAVVKYAFLVDHYVTVLKVDGRGVTIADPLNGKVELTHAEFARRWRNCSIVLQPRRARQGRVESHEQEGAGDGRR